jgi:polyhydroxyalkanoate synthase
MQTQRSSPATVAPAVLPQLSLREAASVLTELGGRMRRVGGTVLRKQAGSAVSALGDELGVGRAFLALWARVLLSPVKLARANVGLTLHSLGLAQHVWARLTGQATTPIAQPAKGDNRFKDEAWQQRLLFDVIKQSYLLISRYLQELAANTEGLSPEARKKVLFFTRQYVEAMSPTNFVLTNPTVLRETVRTRGLNLLKGLSNLLADLEAGGGNLRVRMTDMEAFKVGVNVATSPGKVVSRNDLAELIHFEPASSEQLKRPLLIIPPWINKFYILDLRETNSFIRWANAQGHSVFVLSWVNPDARLAAKTFDDYMVEGPLAALSTIERITGEPQANVIGYCLGGTLLGATLGYLAARGEDRIASATFFVSLLDFSIPGELGVFIDERQLDALDKRMRERGFLEGSEMATTFSLLRANDLVWSFVVNNYLLGRDPAPFDLLFWNSDSTRMPAAMHSFYLRNMYLKNQLKVPGGISLKGTPIDLSKVKVPAYFISTQEDHIAPWQSTYLGSLALGGPVRFVLGGSGHIAGIVNPPSANKYGYSTNDARPSSPEAWLTGAERHEGSWWLDWQKWVSALDPTLVPARVPGAGPVPALGDAPGTYVAARA